MNIIVCIKQVPASSNLEIDPDTGTLIREGAESKMNPFDLSAMETALRFKGRFGARVTALTMGPPQAEVVLREAFMMGADDALLMSDRAFAGADVLATAYTLSRGILESGGFDLIICGSQSTDGDTAQVGPETAEFLGIPHATGVTDIPALSSKDGIIRVTSESDFSIETLDIRMPCLLSVTKDIYQPRLPSYRLKKATADRPITIIKAADLPDVGEGYYGLDGSPTRVVRVFPPEHNTEHETFEGNAAELAERMYQLLLEGRCIPEGTVKDGAPRG